MKLLYCSLPGSFYTPLGAEESFTGKWLLFLLSGPSGFNRNESLIRKVFNVCVPWSPVGLHNPLKYVAAYLDLCQNSPLYRKQLDDTCWLLHGSIWEHICRPGSARLDSALQGFVFPSQPVCLHEEALRRVSANKVSPLTQLQTRFIFYNILTLSSKLQAFIVKQRYRKRNTTSWKSLKDQQDERKWDLNTPTRKNTAQLGAEKLVMVFNWTIQKKVINILSLVEYGQVHWPLRCETQHSLILHTNWKLDLQSVRDVRFCRTSDKWKLNVSSCCRQDELCISHSVSVSGNIKPNAVWSNQGQKT